MAAVERTSPRSTLQHATNIIMLVASLLAIYVLVRAELRRMVGPVRAVRITESSALEKAGAALRTGADGPPIYILSDFQCPFCNSYRATIDSVEQALAAPINIRVVHLPLPMHSRARATAVFAECYAGAGGEFRQAYEALFAHQPHLDTLELTPGALGLPVTAALTVEACDGDGRGVQRMTADSMAVAALGASATPTVIVGAWQYLTPPSAQELAAAVKRVGAGKRPAGSGGFARFF